MESVLIVGLVVGLVVFASIMLASSYGKARAHRHEEAFQAYVAERFPEVPRPAKVLLAGLPGAAKQFRALLVSPERHEIIVLDQGREGITHRAYPFGALTGAGSTSRIISRGLPGQRVFSYEQTMNVGFDDGTTVPFGLEAVTNKHGTDKAPGAVAAIFAPWEQQLQTLVGQAPTRPAPEPEATPDPAPAPVATATTPAAAWYPDPVGRHEVRYWNGHMWTAAVADHGAQASDPLEGAA